MWPMAITPALMELRQEDRSLASERKGVGEGGQDLLFKSQRAAAISL